MKSIGLGLGLFLFCTLLQAQAPINRDSLRQLGNFYWNKSELFYPSNFDSCIYYTQLAQPFFEQAEAWSSYVNCTNGLSTLYYQIGDFEKYIQSAQSALQQAEHYLGNESKPYGFALNNLGSFYLQKGDPNQAIRLYKNSLLIQEQYDSLTPFIVNTLSRTYKNLGNAYYNKKDHLEALRYYEKALWIRKESPQVDPPSIANNHFNMGNCYRWMDQLDSALVHYEQGLHTLNRDKQQKGDFAKKISIHCYHGLAQVYLLQAAPQKAWAALQQAIPLQQAQGAYRMAQSKALLGQCYAQQDQPQRAIQSFEAAIVQYQKNHPQHPSHQSLAAFYRQIAETQLHIQQPLRALQSYQQALQMLAYEFDKTDHYPNPKANQLISKADALKILDGKAQCLIMLAQQQTESRHRQQAYHCYQLAKQLIRDLRNEYLASGSKHLLAAEVLPLYERAIDNALVLYQQSGARPYLEDAFNSAESNKALLLLESLHENWARQSGGIPDSLLQKEHQLVIDLAFYHKKIQEEKQTGERANSHQLQQWENERFDLQTRYHNLVGLLETQFPVYYAKKYQLMASPLNELQSQLSEQSCLLEYFIGAQQGYVFQIQPQSISVRAFAWSNEQQQWLKTFREKVRFPPSGQKATNDFQQFTTTGHQLYNLLLAPELSTTQVIHELILVPDPQLALLPFELLLRAPAKLEPLDYGPNQLQYLLEDFAISYDYSTQIYQLNRQPKVQLASKAFAGFAPSFHSPIAMEERACIPDQLYSLQCSETEVTAIQRLLGGDIFQGAEASKQFFEQAAKHYQVLHLATHACLDESDPMFNRIYFTDDHLSSYELSALQLQAELAVLSACNTGAGQLIEGEGIMSLARSFVQAGCPSTVMSLWPINDCSTSEIMQHFYAFLKAGNHKNEALRQAKLAYLNSAKKRERHPYYWAAFVQFGHTAPLSPSAAFPALYWLLGFALLGGLLFILFRATIK
ncbi:MAG: CHAT domain-containing tetratricopeptide repeat protein, partial [Bacteroidota bacterium]